MQQTYQLNLKRSVYFSICIHIYIYTYVRNSYVYFWYNISLYAGCKVHRYTYTYTCIYGDGAMQRIFCSWSLVPNATCFLVCKVLTRAAQDVRVLVIKFADRMHNMRTLEKLQSFQSVVCISVAFDCSDSQHGVCHSLPISFDHGTIVP